jgi:hypothetical protein
VLHRFVSVIAASVGAFPAIRHCMAHRNPATSKIPPTLISLRQQSRSGSRVRLDPRPVNHASGTFESILEKYFYAEP